MGVGCVSDGAALRRQVMADGRVLVSLRPRGEVATVAVLSPEAAKAFAWGLLADLEPEEAFKAGAPVDAFGFPPDLPRAARPVVRYGPGPEVAAVLAACPEVMGFGIGDVVAALPGLTSRQASNRLKSLWNQGFVTLERGEGARSAHARGRHADTRWRVTDAGRALRAKWAAMGAGAGA